MKSRKGECVYIDGLSVTIITKFLVISSSVGIHIRTVLFAFELSFVRDVSGDFTFGTWFGTGSGSDGDGGQGVGET